MKKIVVVGLGNVGFTFINIAVARGLQAEFVFVDKNEEVADAHAHDFADMASLMPRNNSTFRHGTLADAKGADIVVIAASIPAGKEFADRLALAGKNAQLMKSFGEQLKAAGFKGTVIVPANPCDVMAAAIHYSTGLPFKKVISTGTYLDSARLRKFVAQKLNVAADSVDAHILAEHGASCMAAWSTLKVGDSTLKDLIKAKKIRAEELDELLKRTIAEGFYIYQRKGNTQFGIGTSIYEIVDAVLNNKRLIMTVGVKLPKGYKNAGIYTSIPVVVGENGYEYLPFKPNLTKEEWAQFEASTEAMAKVHRDTLGQIGIEESFE